MYYGFELISLPHIHNVYTVTRKTVWQITDKQNILIFIESGSCQISCEGETFVLAAGDVFFVPSGYSYKRSPVENEYCTMTYIHFSVNSSIGEYDDNALYNILTASKDKINREILSGEQDITYPHTVYLKKTFKLEDTDKILNQVHEIQLNTEKKTLSSGLNQSIALCSILVTLSQRAVNSLLTDISINGKANKTSKNLKRAISYIMQNYFTQITLDELAAYCCVSKQQLIRYFKSELNTTPIKYITDYKVSRAKELLFNHPQLSIGEIAEELGFDNQHYFSKVFTASAGETPSHYRYRTLNFDKLQGK